METALYDAALEQRRGISEHVLAWLWAEGVIQ